MALKWRRVQRGVQEAFCGPMVLSVVHNDYLEDEGMDPWTARVRFADGEAFLFGGQRFKTEEQIKDAVAAWLMETIAGMSESLRSV